MDDYIFIPGMKAAIAEGKQEITGYILGDTVREIHLYWEALTDNEKEIVLSGSLQLQPQLICVCISKSLKIARYGLSETIASGLFLIVSKIKILYYSDMLFGDTNHIRIFTK